MQMIRTLFPGQKKPRQSTGLVPTEPGRIIKRTRLGMQLSHFPSHKLGRVVECESSIESDLALMFDCDPEVITYCEQPMTVTLNMPNGSSHYTPDFITEHENGTHTFWEVKPEGWWLSPYWWERLRAAKQYFESKGFEFVIITDDEIRCTPFVSNLRTIYPRTQNVSPDQFFKVEELVVDSDFALTVADAVELMEGDFDAVATYALAACRRRLGLVAFNNSFLLKEV